MADDGGYRIEEFAGQATVTAADLVSLWTREAELDDEEAARRVAEVLLVATHGGELAGITTAYLQHNQQLRADMWYLRAFVAGRHRMSAVAVTLAMQSRDLLVARYVSGEDVRGLGVLMEVENEGLKRTFNHALWQPTIFRFIGDGAFGAHVRIHPFPGAHAPLPA